MWRFEVRNTLSGQASWWLYAGNGEMVAWAGETFASTYNAHRAASAFKSGARSARYDIYRDAENFWRWRAWRGSDKVAASGESFVSRYSAERAANRVRDLGGGAADAAA